MSRSVDTTCVVCGKELTDPSRSRYCSNACRQRAYRLRLTAAARAGAAPGSATTAPDMAGTLPAPVDSFVGRRRDVDRLLYLMSRHRMVTLVGTAGVGKTRLAVELANRLPGRRSRQLALVELDVLDGGDLLPQTIAAAFGVREQRGRPVIESVFEALRGEPILVLDNCEHLIEPCAEFADQALRRCPGLRVLATSREALDIPGEVVYPVNGLSLPAAAPDLDRMNLLRSDAVRLFLDRARQYRHDFEITEDNATHVVEVCAKLEGSPLAIELAARWVQLLPMATIHARLARRFELLTGSRRTVRDRQRSLWEAIDWSYQLLNPAEQLILRRLSVFSGPFDLETATAVCADPYLAVERVFDLVFRLHAKSLVAPTAEASRFRLPDSIRLYARQRLDASGDAPAAMERLVDWLTVLAEPLVDQPVWFPRETQERLDRMADNLVAAARFTETTDDPRHAVLVMALIRCWLPRGYFTEARKLVRAALDRVDAAHRCLLLSYGGYLAALQGDVHEALGLPAEALELARAAKDQAQMLTAHYTLGTILVPAGRVDKAVSHLTQCLAQAREIGDPAAVAMALERLAWATLQQGDVDAAESLLAEALPVFREEPRPHGFSLAMHTGGRIALARDQLDEAEDYFREALRTVTTSWLEVPFTLEGLAIAAGRRGDVARSVRLFRAAATIRGGDRLHAEPQWHRMIGDLVAPWDSLTGDEIDRIADQVAGRNREEVLAYALRDIWGDVENAPAPELDDDERRIVVLVTEGLTNREVADRIGVSVRTVAYGLRRIREKLGLRSREEIPAWAAAHTDALP